MRYGPVSFIARLIFIAALIGVWEWGVDYFQTPIYILPAPSSIAPIELRSAASSSGSTPGASSRASA